jgi:gluconate kinase
LVFVPLDGESTLIAQRMHARPGHFMPPALAVARHRGAGKVTTRLRDAIEGTQPAMRQIDPGFTLTAREIA